MRPSRLGVLVLVSLLLGSCTHDFRPEIVWTRAHRRVWNGETPHATAPSPGSVVVLLPISNRVVAVNPETLRAVSVLDLDDTWVGGPAVSAVVENRLIVAGGAPGPLASINLETGGVRHVRRMHEVGHMIEGIVEGPEGQAYLATNWGGPLTGALIELDPRSLAVTRRIPLSRTRWLRDLVVRPDGTVVMAGRAASGGGAVAFLAPGRRPRVQRIKGTPRAIALGPEGKVVVVLHEGALVEVDAVTGEGRSIGGSSEPFSGIAVTPTGEALVVGEGIGSGSLHFVDLDSMELVESISLPDCDEPRGVVISAGRAVVACSGSEGVFVIDVDARATIGFVSLLSLEDPVATDGFFDEPRGLSVIPSESVPRSSR